MSKEGGRRGRDDGMARAIAHANPAWVKGVRKCIKIVAYRQAELSSDDVMALVKKRRVPPTHENRALGPLMKEAERQGYIKTTKQFEDSNRTSKHLSPIRVWESRVHGWPPDKPVPSKKVRDAMELFNPPPPPPLRVVK